MVWLDCSAHFPQTLFVTNYFWGGSKMLLANEIRPPEIKRPDPSSKTAAFEVHGWRDHVFFSVSGSFPVPACPQSGETPSDEASALKQLLRDIANTL